MIEQTQISQLLTKWNIGQIEKIEQVPTPNGKVKSLHMLDGQIYYLKEKEHLQQIDKEVQLYSALSKDHIETSIPLQTVEGKLYVEEDGKIYCLYKAVTGQTILEHFEGNAQERAFLFGRAIGLLHKGLIESQLEELYSEMKLKDQLENWAVPKILQQYSSGDQLFQSIITELSIEFFPHIDQLPTQIIHRDAHPANILLNGTQCGFIDFDISRRGIRIFDLCYCSTSILMSRFSEADKREKWPDLLRELVKGYHSSNHLSAVELKSIFYVILAIQMIFTAYFYDLDNVDAAKLNLEALYLIYNNKSVIQEAVSTVTREE